MVMSGNNFYVYMIIFVLVLAIVYLIAWSVIELVDSRLGNIEVKMPKIEIRAHDLRENFPSDSKESLKVRVGTDPILPHEMHSMTDETTDRTDNQPVVVKTVVGCKRDSDCNIVNGDGKNVCKSDGSCFCLAGSGLFCQYGPTNYKDPKDMTDEERKIFKYKFRNNFTLQDYKNWLMLYKDDPEHLREHHRNNLKILLRGGQLDVKDIPAVRMKPPLKPADYFVKMYEGGRISVHFPDQSETGAMLGYNYQDFGDFIPPDNVDKQWITGIVDLYNPVEKDDAKAVNGYLRPDVTVGAERELVGNEYLNSVRQYHTLADIRKLKERQDTNKSLVSFYDSDQNVGVL